MNTNSEQANTAKIQNLNDQFRKTFIGGSVLITPAVEALAPDRCAALRTQIRAFDGFSPENDPYDEHDFGSIEIANETYFFKIDYYDRSMEVGSPDPADPRCTSRVMTIMRADEY